LQEDENRCYQTLITNGRGEKWNNGQREWGKVKGKRKGEGRGSGRGVEKS